MQGKAGVEGRRVRRLKSWVGEDVKWTGLRRFGPRRCKNEDHCGHRKVERGSNLRWGYESSEGVVRVRLWEIGSGEVGRCLSGPFRGLVETSKKSIKESPTDRRFVDLR